MVHLHYTKVTVFLYIFIFSGCLVSPAQISEDEILQSPKKDLNNETLQIQQIQKAYYEAIPSQALLQQIPPLIIEVREALSDSHKIKELQFKSSTEALHYERELLDILQELNLIEKMLIDFKSNIQFESKQTIQNHYLIPKLSFKLATMQKIALENRPETIEYNEEIYLKILTQVQLCDERYKQSVKAYKLSKEYLDLSEEIYKQALITDYNTLKALKERFNYFLAVFRHSIAYAAMQKSYMQAYSTLGILKDSDVSYKKDRPETEEDFKLQLQIQKNKRMLREKELAKLQVLEQVNEIQKQKQFQIMKQLEEKRRLQRVQKRNQKRRLEISKKLQAQRKINSQAKQEDKIKKIDEIDSLDGIRKMLEEIKVEIAYFEKNSLGNSP